MRSNDRRPRLFFTSAAGNAIGTYLAWSESRPFSSEMSLPYTTQFFQLSTGTGAIAYIVANTDWSTSFNGMVLSAEDITVEHRMGSIRRSGWGWHVAQLTGSVSLLVRLLRFRPDVVIVSEATISWPILPVARLVGARIYLSLHTRLWPETGKPRGPAARVMLALNGWFLRRHCSGGVAVSRAIIEQVREQGCHAPFETFLPSYRREDFSPPAGRDGGSLRILYAGRIEVFKGVMDLVEVIDHLRAKYDDAIQLDVCGRGGADGLLRDEIERRQLHRNIHVHGHCNRVLLGAKLSECDIVVVPSRTEFVEGCAKTVIEGALAGKPVVTSRVCPAMHDIGDAAIEVEPDNWRGYADAIEKLFLDPALFATKAAAAAEVRDRYFDHANGFAAKLESVIAHFE